MKLPPVNVFLYNFLLNFVQIVKFNFLTHLTQHNLLWMILGCFKKAHKLMTCNYWRFPQHQGDGKTPMLGKTEEQKEKRVAQDEMVRWHHRFNGHELGQTSGDSEGQGGLACCSTWSSKELDTTWWANNNSKLLPKIAHARFSYTNPHTHRAHISNSHFLITRLIYDRYEIVLMFKKLGKVKNEITIISFYKYQVIYSCKYIGS